MPFYVYLVECSDGTYYCGYTKNLKERIHDHNHTKNGAWYTRHRRPVKLVYGEEFETKKSAMSREYEIKHFTRRDKENLAAYYKAQ